MKPLSAPAYGSPKLSKKWKSSTYYLQIQYLPLRKHTAFPLHCKLLFTVKLTEDH